MVHFNRLRFSIFVAVCLLALSVVFSSSLLAQTTGKVEGIVTDVETGEPLVGAQVIIGGTLLGNITSDEGYYFILNVPVGLQSVKAQIIGYQAVTVLDVRILAGQTHAVDFTLKSTVLELPGQEIYGDREPLVPRDNTVSKERFTGETALEAPTDNVTQVITLQAGVTRFGNRYSIRGGRPEEAAIYIDGVNTKSYTTDGIQAEDDLDVGENAVEAVDVITGGFSSDFGDAQSGIVNIVTKEGGKKYSGQFRIETDEFMPSTSNYGYNRAQFSVGGPIPAIAENLSFFFSGEITGMGDGYPRSDGFKGSNDDIGWLADMYSYSDEVNNYLGHDLDINEQLATARSANSNMPILDIESLRSDNGDYVGRLIGNSQDETRIQAKVAWQASKNIKLTGTFINDRDQGLVFNRNMMFWENTSNSVFSNGNMLGIVGYNHTISQSAERSSNLQVRASFQRSYLVQGPKYNLDDETAAFGNDLGFDSMRNILNYRIGAIPIFLEDLKGGHVQSLQDVLDRYQYDFELRTGRNGQNPFGVPAAGFFDADVGYFDFLRTMEEDRANLRLDFDSQINKIHRIRAGTDVKYWQVDYFSNNLTSSTFLNFFNAKPDMQSFYVEDRMDFQDLVIDLGFRIDSFDAGVMAPRVIGEQDDTPFNPAIPGELNSREGGGVKPPRLTEISPRLGVAHPVTDKTQIRLSYGSKYQVPSFLHLYRGINIDLTEQQNTNQFFGNPYMGFRKTTSFEVGMTTLLSEDWVVDIVGYNRDIDGNVSARYLQQTSPDGADLQFLRIYTNVDNGNVKGFDFTLRRRFSKYYAMDIAYTMLYARSTGTDPEDFVRNEGFFIGGDRPPLPPVEVVPNDYDQTHTFNYQFNVKLPGDFREGTGLGKALRNSGFYFTLQTNSGRPYTTQNENFDFIERSNESRRGWEMAANLRVVKDLKWGGLDYSVFADVRNIFNNVNLSSRQTDVFSSAGVTNGVYQTTGSPFSDGQTVQRAIDDIGVDDPSLYTGPRTTDMNGDGVFNAADDAIIVEHLDFNGDGIVSVEEELTMRLLARGANDANPFNFERPREVRLGFEMRF